jgi:hypothetical protein
MFANQSDFDAAASHHLARGVDLNGNTAFKDAQGNILFRAQTGGILQPQKAELREGQSIYRFGGSGRGALATMSGGWWMEAASFDRVNKVSDPMAARILCGVPPEWSDMTLLVRARLRKPLLAWRGLANSVIVPHPKGGPNVTMLHQNANAERRVHQLFIPGLNRPGLAQDALLFEGEWHFSATEATRGWLYL